MIPGDLVLIREHSTYSDVFGLYLGWKHVPRWDPKGEFMFHQVLTPEGVKEFCIRSGRERTVFVVVE